jgi:hypothetical protein
VPCGIDFCFWQSVGIGIGFFCSDVSFRSGSESVLGLKKVFGFSVFSEKLFLGALTFFHGCQREKKLFFSR